MGDPQGYGEEDDRGDEHFDEFDKTIAQGLELGPKFRPEQADRHPGNHADDDLKVKGLIERDCLVRASIMIMWVSTNEF